MSDTPERAGNPDVSSGEHKLRAAMNRKELVELNFASADTLVHTATALMEMGKQASEQVTTPAAFDDQNSLLSLAADPMIQRMLAEERHGPFLLYTQRDEPSELLGPLKTWDAKIFPYKTIMEVNPAFHTAVFEIDESTDIFKRGLPDPESAIMFMAFTLEDGDAFRERQIVFRDDGRAEVKDFAFLDKVPQPFPDWEEMSLEQLGDLNEDLTTLYDRMAQKMIGPTQ